MKLNIDDYKFVEANKTWYETSLVDYIRRPNGQQVLRTKQIYESLFKRNLSMGCGKCLITACKLIYKVYLSQTQSINEVVNEVSNEVVNEVSNEVSEQEKQTVKKVKKSRKK